MLYLKETISDKDNSTNRFFTLVFGATTKHAIYEKAYVNPRISLICLWTQTTTKLISHLCRTRTSRWIFTSDNSGRTHDSRSSSERASRRSASVQNSSRTFGYPTLSSSTRNSRTFTSLPPATSSFAFTTREASRVAYGE